MTTPPLVYTVRVVGCRWVAFNRVHAVRGKPAFRENRGESLTTVRGRWVLLYGPARFRTIHKRNGAGVRPDELDATISTYREDGGRW